MFVAYLDHALAGIRIQDRECWYLEVGSETETSKGMLPGINREGAGESLHGLFEKSYKWVLRGTLPCLPVRVFPAFV